MVNIFETALGGMVLIFVIAVIWIIAVVVVGGYIYPMFSSERMSPSETSPGMSKSQYQNIMDFLFRGFNWFFYIMLAIPFVYLLVKFLYEKEEVSVR